jgi:glycosyltransferase involved in cell wall biosynthesis
MKFSVLLPTRNRLEYLKYAIETVRRQDYGNWEVIVSDNVSDDDVAGYASSLNDGRIKYFRTTTLIPVTENWNYALQQSCGDQVIMLGDDDGLLPGYFSTLLRIFKQWPDPDFVYTGAYFFAYPGAVADQPEGFLRRDRNRIFVEERTFWLDPRRARRVARGYLNFRMPVASNMQLSLISRRQIVRLTRAGKFFHSPFPDFYATPSLFLHSDRILVCPLPLVAIGITPKSYGSFHFKSDPSGGVKFLQNQEAVTGEGPIRSVMIPGTSYNDSWLLAMESLYINFDRMPGTRPNYRRYRFLQIVHEYKKRYLDRCSGAEDLQKTTSRMTLGERVLYGPILSIGFALLRALPSRGRGRIIGMLRAIIGQHAIQRSVGTEPRYRNLLEVYEALGTKTPPLRAGESPHARLSWMTGRGKV